MIATPGATDTPVSKRTCYHPRTVDRLLIRGLRATTTVGVHDWEQRAPREIVLNLELSSDVASAAASDSIEDAVSYSAVSGRLIAFLASSRTRLVETLAERCADLVLSEFSIAWVRVELFKPGAVSEAEAVGVVIERGVAQA
jgi:dihydroneopterin aldolase